MQAEAESLREQAQKIASSGALGRSRSYARLLEFLVDCGVAGRAPKELEIAMEVFGKGADFDPSQDSMVRVYAHNLRQKLEHYYATDGRNEPLTVGYHKVSVDIRDQIARTVVEESFVNHTGGRLEGVFYFPLPADASISGFGMWINGELVEADVVEKERAREEKRTGCDAHATSGTDMMQDTRETPGRKCSAQQQYETTSALHFARSR